MDSDTAALLGLHLCQVHLEAERQDTQHVNLVHQRRAGLPGPNLAHLANDNELQPINLLVWAPNIQGRNKSRGKAPARTVQTPAELLGAFLQGNLPLGVGLQVGYQR